MHWSIWQFCKIYAQQSVVTHFIKFLDLVAKQSLNRDYNILTHRHSLAKLSCLSCMTLADQITETECFSVISIIIAISNYILHAMYSHAKNWHISWVTVKYHWILDESAQYLGESERRGRRASDIGWLSIRPMRNLLPTVPCTHNYQVVVDLRMTKTGCVFCEH